MRTSSSFCRRLVVGLGVAAASLVAASASAQQPAGPPPGFAPPPPGFAPPPAGYAPPQGYAQPGYGQQPGYPPAGYAPPPGYYAPPVVYGPPAAMGPKVMDYDEGQPVPSGYHLETRTRKGLAITGGVLFGSFYLISAFSAAVASDTGDHDAWPFWVPAIGPFIALGTEGHNLGSDKSTVTFLYVLDGVVQTGGLAMLIAGIAFPATKLVRDDVALFNDKVHVRATPVALGRGQYGFGFSGTF